VSHKKQSRKKPWKP